MKKIMLLMFCIVFLMGTISSFEFDNIKQYDEETKTITIKNSFLGLPLDKVATIQLKTSREMEINNIYDYIAEFEIENFEAYNNFLKEVESFIGVDGGEVLDYNYYYRYYDENVGTHSEMYEQELTYPKEDQVHNYLHYLKKH